MKKQLTSEELNLKAQKQLEKKWNTRFRGHIRNKIEKDPSITSLKNEYQLALKSIIQAKKDINQERKEIRRKDNLFPFKNLISQTRIKVEGDLYDLQHKNDIYKYYSNEAYSKKTFLERKLKSTIIYSSIKLSELQNKLDTTMKQAEEALLKIDKTKKNLKEIWLSNPEIVEKLTREVKLEYAIKTLKQAKRRK